jgi:peptide deformylase
MPNKLPLTYYPSPNLQQPSKPLPVNNISSTEIQALIADMGLTMHEEKGIGLAAPQIGRNIRLTVIRTQDGDLALINPKIIRRSFKKIDDSEGCLSIPGVYGQVKRAAKISVTATGADGQPLKFQAEGLFARVIQHEVDHLDGVLFIQRTKLITEGQELLDEYAVKAKS